jgi:acetyl/propionyl-CoA carboxylase alpha subunit
MKYRLTIAEETEEVDASRSDSGQAIRVCIRETEHLVCYQQISPGHFHLVTNGRATQVFVARAGESKHIFVNGRTFFVQDADRLSVHRAGRGGSEEGPGEVTPPMPSVVVRILVKEGEQVKRGQGVVVVSAMKMETTLRAPSDGFVRKINTVLNAKVSPGDILVEIQEEVPDHE